MTQQTRTALKELQTLDTRIEEALKKVRAFDPLFEEVEEPALVLERDMNTTRTRLQEMRLEERRLELSSEEKRVRLQRLEERLNTVRNLREEAAVSSELDMVRRALQSDEQEAFTLLDQIRKLEERLEEVTAAYEEARVLVEPRREALLAERAQAQVRLDALRQERSAVVVGMDAAELRMYDGIRAGGRGVAVADLTEDGACGFCFSMVPLQVQNEIRHGEALIRCEGCGVILSAPDPRAAAAAAQASDAPPAGSDGPVADAGTAEAAPPEEGELEPASETEPEAEG